MNKGEIKRYFNIAFTAPNFITPNIMDYMSNGNFIAEISYGNGITGETIYGVTVIQVDKERKKLIHRIDLGNVFMSVRDCIKHVESLANEEEVEGFFICEKDGWSIEQYSNTHRL